jgi:MYXO-CTERM domain-containing protein
MRVGSRRVGKRANHVALAAFLGVGLATLPALADPWDKPGWTITFHDEFDGPSLDASAWGKRYKWGEAVINGELEAYVDDAFAFQDGALRIVATQAQGTYAGQTMSYRSGLIASVHEQTYGYFEMRCRMPKGKGYWPAFWLLASNAPGVNEIDIHEFLGDNVNTIYTTVHWGPSYTTGHMSDGKAFTGPDFTADFHTFGVEWDPAFIAWNVDGQEVHRHTGDGIPTVNMYIIANLAVGGGWPGAPDATTVFPGYYDIDYIRAYERDADAGAPPADAGSDGGGLPGTGAGGGPSSSTGGGAEPANGTKGCACGTAPASSGRGALAAVAALLVAVVGARRRIRDDDR